MSIKEIIGFKEKEIDNDSICPNCKCDNICIPIRSVETSFFKYNIYDYYTCNKCGCQWRVRIR